MKNKFNTLQKYIFENSVKEYHKETVNGLFRAILEPIVSEQNSDFLVLFRIFDTKGRDSLLKRLSFMNAQIYSFSDVLDSFGLSNSEKSKIWNDTEFLIVLGSRYSASFIWDYSTGEKPDYTNISLFYNSKIVNDFAKIVLENSIVDFRDSVQKYVPDRRENLTLNSSINSIAQLLNEKNEETILAEVEKEFALNSDDVLKTASVVSEKAKFIAHEIKNNLSIINLYSKITEKRLEKVHLDDEVQTSIDTALKNINNSSQMISNLINDLRCLSAQYKTEFSIKQFILNTVLLCTEKANKSNVEIVVSEINDVTVFSDITKLQCTLTNIIFNAVEACTSGCVIKISAFNLKNVIKIVISNNGEKISEENQKHIFDENFTTKPKGNGIGLAFCRQQLKLLGGDVALVKSDDDETIFEITLNLD